MLVFVLLLGLELSRFDLLMRRACHCAVDFVKPLEPFLRDHGECVGGPVFLLIHKFVTFLLRLGYISRVAALADDR